MRRSPSRGRPPGNRSKIPGSVRQAVERRSGGRCEARVNGHCAGKGGHLHHKRMRSQGGQHTEENLIDVCMHCHQWIHGHTGWAYDHGLLIRAGAV